MTIIGDPGHCNPASITSHETPPHYWLNLGVEVDLDETVYRCARCGVLRLIDRDGNETYYKKGGDFEFRLRRDVCRSN